ncbi:hypothetical protein SARC_05979 [Sphaeroforma arctica JP610]|uniref:Uncharacterized protein n=1 Tax=Sphaeroforma arctica JP610 TaxID=667725 RepID=A0A0L0FY09_9EUKA|nr:hypothetical protein SARC_05979 [Sphaeroforma arctica JP610]KNC81707.1 hypothetical protein SARC_05979 [Sphaeroforma arctica JP610]|eukprot:XP_014155609.1 hypothetical protein SARC_05979 [Sphaeroforma arctica JP610]
MERAESKTIAIGLAAGTAPSEQEKHLNMFRAEAAKNNEAADREQKKKQEAAEKAGKEKKICEEFNLGMTHFPKDKKDSKCTHRQ